MVDLDKSVKSYFNQGKYIFLYNVFERLTFFAFYISIARYVDKETYGLVVSVSAFTNILASIFDLGLPFYIQRESAIGKFGEKDLINVLLLKIFQIFLLSILPIIYFRDFQENLGIILLITAINFYQSVNQVLVFFLYGNKKYNYSFFSIFYSRLIYFTSLVLVVYIRSNIFINLVILFISLIIQTIYLFYIIKLYFLIDKKISEKRNFLNFHNIFSIVKKALPFGLINVLDNFADKLDILLINFFWSNSIVAEYSIANSLYKHTSLFSILITLQFYNEFSITFLEKKNLRLEKILSGLIALIFMLLILIISFVLIGKFIISFLWGTKYLGAFGYLLNFLFVLPLLFFTNFFGFVLYSIDKEKINLVISIISILIISILYYFLIRLYGGNGAILSIFLTKLIVLFIQFFYLRNSKLIR